MPLRFTYHHPTPLNFLGKTLVTTALALADDKHRELCCTPIGILQRSLIVA